MTAVLSMSGGLAGGAASDDRDPRPALLAAPMSTAQKLGIAVTLLITTMDGYDILAASFAAPSLTVEWRLTHAVIGMILGVNLIGIGLGALVISPLADRIGRRLTILPCLLLVAASMFLSGFATGAPVLAVTRLVSGVGIGGLVGATLSLAVEYANARNRLLAAAVMSIGLPLGGVVGGATAAVLLKAHGWQSIFILGGFISLGVAAVAAVWLPESVDFLMGRRDGAGLPALNRVLARFGHAPVGALPARADDRLRAGERRGAAIFGQDLRATTLTMVVVNFAQMMTIFYFISWLPQMVADMRFTGSAAAGVSIVQNIFGILGALSVGWLARRWPVLPMTIFTMAGTAGAILLFALLPPDMGLLKAGAALEGFMALGCSAAIYGVMARAFPAAARSTGTGFAYAFGRLGSIVAAVVPGLLFTRGWTLAAVAGLMGLGSLASVVALLLWNARGGPRSWTAHLPEVA